LDLKQLTDEELRGSIEERLMSDWILIRGDPEVVGILEKVVYPPAVGEHGPPCDDCYAQGTRAKRRLSQVGKRRDK